MNSIFKGIVLATAAAACAAAIAEESAPALEPREGQSRWRISAGARFAPGVKASAKVSSKAVAAEAIGAGGARGSSGESAPTGPWTTTALNSSERTESVTESVSVGATDRLEFDNGFIDMNDDAGNPGETVNWHFDSADAFSQSAGTGRVTARKVTSVTTPGAETVSRPTESAVAYTSRSVSYIEAPVPDLALSHESDVWGGDVEVGYDLVSGKRFSLGVGIGATLYRSADAIKAAGRCGAVSASVREETTSGTVSSTSRTSASTTVTTTEETTFTDPGFAYAGAIDDIRNDDGSIGAGTPDGYTNPYGGPNPVLTVSNGSVSKTTTTVTRDDTATVTENTFTPSGTSTRTSGYSRDVAVKAEGDVEMREVRLALQPSWKATEWLELRGAMGIAATQVSVDVDTTIFVDGAAWRKVSGDDSGWVFAGLLGFDAVASVSDSVGFFAGCDLRLGGGKMDYDAGLVSGRIELPNHTFRAGVAVAW